MIDTRDQLGRQQELAFLPLTQVPAWLTHINPDKIGGGPEQIEKLKQYQVEAVDVLYKHFVGPQQAVPAQDPLGALAESVMASAKLALEMRQTQLGSRVRSVRSGPTSMPPSNRSMTWSSYVRRRSAS